MVKIVNLKHANQKLNFPDMGLVEIGEDGILEVEESLAEIVVSSKIGWSYFGETKEEKVDLDISSEEIDAQIENLQKLSLNDLIQLATDAQYPESEWLKLSQNTKNATKLMIGYITKKLKA